MFRYFLILPLLLSSLLAEYGCLIKREGEDSITHLQIFAERCSGSNYTGALIEKNCYLKRANFGHKHYPPWFSLPKSEYRGPKSHYTFEGNKNTLFVMVVRDPYDWVRSYYSWPYGSEKSMKRLTFSQFIREPYRCDRKTSDYRRYNNKNPLFELDPETRDCFVNLLFLRTAKINNMLKIHDKVSNFYLIRYEEIRDHPEEVLGELASIFGLELSDHLIPIETSRNWGKKPYVPKSYFPIEPEDLEFINSQLDWEVEESLGYQFKREVS